MGVMKAFNTGAFDSTIAIRLVKALFREHPDLIEGFKAFLHPSLHLCLDSATPIQRWPQPPRDYELRRTEAMSYIQTARQQLSGEPETYNQFMSVINAVQHGPIDGATAIQLVPTISRAYPELIQRFIAYETPSHPVRPNAPNEKHQHPPSRY